MEKMICFPLLLLFCSLCMAQLQPEADFTPVEIPTEPGRREPTNASDHQQTCPQDIYAMLREMSALLAEQRVEMRHLQRENEAQTAELLDLKARTDVTEIEVEALKHDGEVKQVAFSASLLASGSGYVGPFNTDTPLVFRYVVTNIGNAYNPNTGSFIAPVRGAYHFEFYIGTWRLLRNRVAAAWLVKNGANVVTAYQYQTSGFGSSSNGATLLLEVGDVVFLRLWAYKRIFDNENHLSTFSGHLLFTM